MTPNRRALLPLLPSVPLVVLVVTMIGLYLWGPPTSHESRNLLLVLNVLFTTLVSVFIAILTARSFLTSGRPALLAICTGMIVWGVSALVAAIGEKVGNYNLTIHNLGVAVSGLCHLAGGVVARRYGERSVHNAGAWLSLGITASLCVVGAIWMSAQQGWLPPFYVEGSGATRLRTMVLIAAIGIFAAAALTWARYRLSGWRFLLWYSFGLALIAAGAVGLILQPVPGSWLGWVARATQYLGGVYMLVGTVITMRESGGWEFSLEERLIRSERAQRKQADLIRTINDNTNELIFMKDRGGRLTYANAATLRLLGRATLDPRTLDRDTFPVQAEHAAIADNDRRVMEAGKTIEVEELFTGADGSRRTFLSTKSPLRDENGEIVGVIGVSRDITDRKQAEQALRDSEAREHERATLLQTVLDTSPMPMWVALDSRCERIVGNPAGDALLGSPRGANVSMNAAQDERYRYRCLRDGVDVPAEMLPMQRAAREGVPVSAEEYEIIRGDGTRVWLLMHASPLVRDGQVRGAISVAVDISGRKLAEVAVRESEALFRTMGEAVPDFLWMADAEGRPIYQNPAWRQYVGVSPEELASRGWEIVHHPEDVPALQRVWAEAVVRGKAFEVEARTRQHDGAYRWFAGRTVPLKDDAGRVVKWVGTMTDIHDRKMAEEALKEADRRKDEFLALLAHELRNPLAPIRNAVQILRRTNGDGDIVRTTSEMLDRQVGQMTRLVDDLLDLSRVTRGKIELKRQRVELQAIVHQAVEAASDQVQCMDHRLTVKMPPQPLHLNADPARLAQVIGNLLHNACKFMHKGGQITLSAEREGEQAVLRVRDGGIGIAADMLPRIFEMFMQIDTSLERSVSGLGIGLTLVKNLTEMHGGTVEVHSDGVGHGCEFVVRLPILVETTEPPLEPSVSEPAPTSGRRVLIVDDNQDGAASLAMLLKLAGHQTQMAHDGLEALKMAEQFRPELALLDIGLPKLNGFDACRRIREQPWGKSMVLVALTGWGQDDDRRKSKDAGFDHHMVKPVDYAALMKLIANNQHPRQPSAS